MKKQTALFFYILGAYVVLQFAWWGYHLIELTSMLTSIDADHQNKRILMIIGEGMVFFILLLFGLWKTRSSIQKEMKMSKQQNNFLLSVTHELKTPLTSNKLYLQTLLKRDTIDRAQQEQLLKKAIEENERLEQMIEKILTATRIEHHYFQLDYETINLSEHIKFITEEWSKNRVPVSLNIEDDIHLKADALVIETALQNLLENAYKYSGNTPAIEVYLKKEKHEIVWGVKDQGKGIAPRHRKEVFGKFIRLGNEETRTQKGTGLGLYIVKHLLLLHNATIIYLPNKPQGAHFKITHTHG